MQCTEHSDKIVSETRPQAILSQANKNPTIDMECRLFADVAQATLVRFFFQKYYILWTYREPASLTRKLFMKQIHEIVNIN